MIFDKTDSFLLDSTHKELIVGKDKMWIIDSITIIQAHSVVLIDNNKKIAAKILKGKFVNENIFLISGSIKFTVSVYLIKHKNYPLLESK